MTFKGERREEKPMQRKRYAQTTLTSGSRQSSKARGSSQVLRRDSNGSRRRRRHGRRRHGRPADARRALPGPHRSSSAVYFILFFLDFRPRAHARASARSSFTVPRTSKINSEPPECIQAYGVRPDSSRKVTCRGFWPGWACDDRIHQVTHRRCSALEGIQVLPGGVYALLTVHIEESRVFLTGVRSVCITYLVCP